MSGDEAWALQERLRRLEEENRRLEIEVAQLNLDEVTGLPGRRAFNKDLVQSLWAMLRLPEARRYIEANVFDERLYPAPHGETRLTLIHGNIDLWLLRYWNNTFGHDCGDRVLRGFARAAEANPVPGLNIYRAGERGDEFVALGLADQTTAANWFETIKGSFRSTSSLPENALFTPNVDVGWATVSDALWAYAAIRAADPESKPTIDDALTDVKQLLLKIADIRSRTNKVVARALLLAEAVTKGDDYYRRVSPHLYGGTHLEPTDIHQVLQAENVHGNEQQRARAKLMAAMLVATRPEIAKRDDARRRYRALSGYDGSDSLVRQVEIEVALYLHPFHRRT